MEITVRGKHFEVPEAAAERALFLESFTKAGLRLCDTPELVAKYPDARRLPECEAERAKVPPRS